jgi:hypothetical protein
VSGGCGATPHSCSGLLRQTRYPLGHRSTAPRAIRKALRRELASCPSSIRISGHPKILIDTSRSFRRISILACRRDRQVQRRLVVTNMRDQIRGLGNSRGYKLCRVRDDINLGWFVILLVLSLSLASYSSILPGICSLVTRLRVLDTAGRSRSTARKGGLGGGPLSPPAGFSPTGRSQVCLRSLRIAASRCEPAGRVHRWCWQPGHVDACLSTVRLPYPGRSSEVPARQLRRRRHLGPGLLDSGLPGERELRGRCQCPQRSSAYQMRPWTPGSPSAQPRCAQVRFLQHRHGAPSRQRHHICVATRWHPLSPTTP